MPSTDYLPVILSSIGVILTLLVNWSLGLIKQRADNKSSDNDAESTFREDLQEQLKSSYGREEAFFQREAMRMEMIDKLRLENIADKKRIAELEFMIIQLQHEISDLKKKITGVKNNDEF